jgi:2',3'-cyclic-nucleotide 2'-phosphodiesterase (5'-nucleotidase family)
VAQVTARWSDSLRTRLGPERNVATAAEPIDARDAVQRSRESVLGDVVTDAMRAGTGADVALMNAGTMRLDDVIQPGRISSYQLESIFLFSDEARIVTFPLTGARVRALLEHSVSDNVLGRGGFLQVSGIAFTYSRRQPDGQRVESLLRADGRSLAPDDTVRVAFDVYPACDGGDGYVVPEAAGACRDRLRGPRSVDLLIHYVQDSLGGRIVRPAGGRIEER